MQFSQIQIANWRQFANVDIAFHPRLTILTGTNGAGKTTILNMLSRALGWQIHLLEVPAADAQAYRETLEEEDSQLDLSESTSGSVTLSSGETLSLSIPQAKGLAQNYGPLRGADGVYITSHRQPFSYGKISNIPVRAADASVLLNEYVQRFKTSYNQIRPQEIIKIEDTPSVRLKQSLISLATFGEGNSIVDADPAALDLFRGFESALRFVLPDEIGFRRLVVKIPEVYVLSKSGIFPLEATSGGMAATIDLAWQVFLASNIFDDFVVLIDEPENHLHPALQKRLLGDLLRAFPSAQFIISTHSPLVITSVRESRVYVLSPSSPGRISASELDLFDRSASAQETLQDVLGVDGSLPQWAEKQVSQLIAKYADKVDDPNALRDLRDELQAQGLRNEFTRIIERLAERPNDQAQ